MNTHLNPLFVSCNSDPLDTAFYGRYLLVSTENSKPRFSFQQDSPWLAGGEHHPDQCEFMDEFTDEVVTG